MRLSARERKIFSTDRREPRCPHRPCVRRQSCLTIALRSVSIAKVRGIVFLEK